MRDGCAAFEHELSAYLDGELPAAERAALDAHLHQCTACRAEIRELRKVGETLRRWDAQETRYATSTGFRNRVLSSLGAKGAEAPADDVRTWRLAAFAAAAAACAVAGFSWASGRDTAPRTTDLAQIESRVIEMERQVAALRDGASHRPSTDGTSAPIDVTRLGDVPSVVREPSADAAAEVGFATEVPWEARTDGMLLRDAVDSYEQFSRERTGLLLEELRAKVDRPDNAAAASTTSAAPAPSALEAYLAQVQVVPAAARAFDRVQVWPIEGSAAPRTQRMLLLEQAIDERILAVSEDESGAVVAVNGDLKGRPVLLLAGDVLKGGRRDRVLRDDVLLAPGRRTSLPVLGASDVRSKTSYRQFTRSRLLAPADLRAFLATGRIGADVTQQDVDQVVDASLTVLGSPGGDRSLENLLTNPELGREVSRYVTEFAKRLDKPNVVGFAVAAGPDLIAIELCGDAATFRALRDRLVRSHVLYALSRPGSATNDAAEGGPPADGEVRALLAEARTASFDEPPATGDGTLWVFRSLGGKSFGYGLADGSRVLHATIFADLPPGGAADVAAGRTARGAPTAVPPGPRDPSSAPDRAGETPRGTGVNGR